MRSSWAKFTQSLHSGSASELVAATMLELAAQLAPHEVLGLQSSASSSTSDRPIGTNKSKSKSKSKSRRLKKLESRRRAWDGGMRQSPLLDGELEDTHTDRLEPGAQPSLRTFTLEAFQQVVSTALMRWRQPHLLLLYLEIHRHDPAVKTLYVRFLRALLGISGETVQDIRFRHPLNARHFESLDANAVDKWQRGDGPGFHDPEAFFMIGHDPQTCMRIRKKNRATNRALLGYVAQGNTRVLGIREGADSTEGEVGPNGRFLSRAMARLLLCKETSETILFVDKSYDEAGGTPGQEALQEIDDQAVALADVLGVRLFTSRDVTDPIGEPGDKGGVGAGVGKVWRLIEVDGAAEYVWREGENGYGVQERGRDREVVLAFVNRR